MIFLVSITLIEVKRFYLFFNFEGNNLSHVCIVRTDCIWRDR